MEALALTNSSHMAVVVAAAIIDSVNTRYIKTVSQFSLSPFFD
jgi:hypothetical protein